MSPAKPVIASAIMLPKSTKERQAEAMKDVNRLVKGNIRAFTSTPKRGKRIIETKKVIKLIIKAIKPTMIAVMMPKSKAPAIAPAIAPIIPNSNIPPPMDKINPSAANIRAPNIAKMNGSKAIAKIPTKNITAPITPSITARYGIGKSNAPNVNIKNPPNNNKPPIINPIIHPPATPTSKPIIPNIIPTPAPTIAPIIAPAIAPITPTIIAPNTAIIKVTMNAKTSITAMIGNEVMKGIHQIIHVIAEKHENPAPQNEDIAGRTAPGKLMHNVPIQEGIMVKIEVGTDTVFMRELTSLAIKDRIPITRKPIPAKKEITPMIAPEIIANSPNVNKFTTSTPSTIMNRATSIRATTNIAPPRTANPTKDRTTSSSATTAMPATPEV